VGQSWVSPVDFWRLAPGEVWWIIEAHKPKDGADRTRLANDPQERARLKKILDEARAEDGASSR
jgi:hypothetical protein